MLNVTGKVQAAVTKPLKLTSPSTLRTIMCHVDLKSKSGCPTSTPSVFLYITAPAPPRKTRGELYKDVDADYYGYRDEDDGVLVPLEQEVEKEGMSLMLDP